MPRHLAQRPAMWRHPRGQSRARDGKIGTPPVAVKFFGAKTIKISNAQRRECATLGPMARRAAWRRPVAAAAPPLLATWPNDADGKLLAAVAPYRLEARRADGRVVGAVQWPPGGAPLAALLPLGSGADPVALAATADGALWQARVGSAGEQGALAFDRGPAAKRARCVAHQPSEAEMISMKRVLTPPGLPPRAPLHPV